MWRGLLRVSKCAILLETISYNDFFAIASQNNVHNALIVSKKTFIMVKRLLILLNCTFQFSLKSGTVN